MYDSYRGFIKNYDRITKDVIIKNIREYSTRYISFLKRIIQKEDRYLWDQEIIFIFNLLIETHQYHFLFSRIFQKLSDEGIGELISNIEPFIYLNRIPVLNAPGLSFMLEYMSKEKIKLLIGRLLCNIDP